MDERTRERTGSARRENRRHASTGAFSSRRTSSSSADAARCHPAAEGPIVSAVHVWWDKSYAKVDYIMDEARPNDGHPYIIGHVEGSTGQSNVLGAMQGTTVVVKTLPQEAFETGKRLPIWHSPDAPNFLVFGTEVNDVPVAALPRRPGVPALIGYSTWLLVTLLVGCGVMVWVGNRWSRIYGNLPMRFRPGSKLRRI